MHTCHDNVTGSHNNYYVRRVALTCEWLRKIIIIGQDWKITHQYRLIDYPDTHRQLDILKIQLPHTLQHSNGKIKNNGKITHKMQKNNLTRDPTRQHSVQHPTCGWTWPESTSGQHVIHINYRTCCVMLNVTVPFVVLHLYCIYSVLECFSVLVLCVTGRWCTWTTVSG